ncbi:MAG TPA: 3-hydroxyacyl-CoA dehydrogenase/enoyl-CoA hydratase family protein [Cyclobacteriaceae bacterium]|nr:3-hydroxyacyl-CoA dehydrogenase/enoyl-CoA hydratase family protein [Cyclobacteriaceae bacterium]
MDRIIRNVAVLGAGIMGTRLACHFANAGLNVLLLGNSRRNPLPSGQEENEAGYMATKGRLEETVSADPSPLFHRKLISRIQTGNIDQDLPRISGCDWVLEVVIEDPGIKKSVFEKVDRYRSPGTLVSTNTSCISVNTLCEGRSEDFKRHFFGAHFFNPPRYLPLLEIIPAEKTDPGIIGFISRYGDITLGKNTIVCKDTPGFIANRIGIFMISRIMKIMDNLKMGIDEVDALTGPAAGRSKSATFRTMDMVGLDTIIRSAENLYNSLPNDNYHESYKLPGVFYELQERNMLGNKTGMGFYTKRWDSKGRSGIYTLDLKNFEYKPARKTRYPSFLSARATDNSAKKLETLYQGKDKAGEFFRQTMLNLFEFASWQVPEVYEEIYKIDEAIRSGFGWEYGPFETWDILGVERVVSDLNSAGMKPADWVTKMAGGGLRNFYSIEKTKKKYFEIPSASYAPIPGKDGIIILDHTRSTNLVWGNSGSSLIDLGDGVLNIEFHSKLNSMGREAVEGINKGIEIAGNDFRGVVIGNQGRSFTAGVNLGILFVLAIEQEYEEINSFIRIFQDTILKVRYSRIPVIVAPHGLCLGGGCEMALHADHVQAAAETYMGLVEARVGLIPGGGGTKEMTRRASNGGGKGSIETNVRRQILENIITAKVSGSAIDAFELKYLKNGDSVTMNQSRVIADGKSAVMRLAESDYYPPDPGIQIMVPGNSGLPAMQETINALKTGDLITAYDAKIAGKIAQIMCGGDMAGPGAVSEQYLLDLEREAFLSLCGERKTLARIDAILRGKKPLRN